MPAPSQPSLWGKFWDRFWAKVDPIQMRDIHACWEWRGAIDRSRNGSRYGKIRAPPPSQKTLRAHRVVCEFYHGPPPTPAHEAGHICPEYENSLCVNPRHVEWQTREENYWRQQNRRGRESVE